MARKPKPMKYRVLINPEIKFTDDDLCRLLFGMNKEQLIKEISDNKGGKYDSLYEKSSEASIVCLQGQE